MSKTEEEKKQALSDLFFEAGAGLYDSQVLEYNIKYLIYLLGKIGFMKINAETAISIIEGKTKHTIGALFKLLRDKGISFSPDTEENLNNALKARNELIHSFLVKDVERMAVTQGREEMVKEIGQFRKVIHKASASIAKPIEVLTILTTGKSVGSIQEDLEKEYKGKGWF